MVVQMVVVPFVELSLGELKEKLVWLNPEAASLIGNPTGVGCCPNNQSAGHHTRLESPRSLRHAR